MSKLILTLSLIFIFSSCATKDPDADQKAMIHMQLGISQLEQNNLPMALNELLLAEKNAPDNPFVQNNLGLVYFLRQKYDISIKHFKKAFDKNPRFTDAENNLARVYIEIKKYDLAEKHLNHVLQDLTYPSQNKAYLNLGMLKFEQKKYNEAENVFNKILLTDQKNCNALVFIGRIYLENRQNSQALNKFKTAAPICLEQGNDDVNYFMAISLYRNNLKKQSLNKFKEIINQKNTSRFKLQSQQMVKYIEKGTL